MPTAKVSYIKVDPRKKSKMRVAVEAIKLAKQNDDPLYKKYAKIKKKMFALRKMLIRRYGPKVMGKVRKSMGTAVRAW